MDAYTSIEIKIFNDYQFIMKSIYITREHQNQHLPEVHKINCIIK